MEPEPDTRDPWVARILEHRVWIVTGKGGTGKTSLAAALAQRAASVGLDALVVSVAGDGALPALFELDEGAGSGDQPLSLAPHLSMLCIEPEVALAEYLELQLHAGGIARKLLRNQGFHKFMDAAPGWRDLVSLGKIWHLEQQKTQAGRPRFDVIVVDAPATGHGLSFLSIPSVVLATVGMGPLHRQTAQIQEMLLDPARARCALVALPEELPVRETLELAISLEALGIARALVFLNRCEPALEVDAPFVRSQLEQLAQRAHARANGMPRLADPDLLLGALDFRERRLSQQAYWRRELESGLEESCIPIPYLFEPLEGRAGVVRLSRELGPSPASAARRDRPEGRASARESASRKPAGGARAVEAPSGGPEGSVS